MDCQWRKSLYCIVCYSYGHSRRSCPDIETKAIQDGLVSDKKNLLLRVKHDPESVKEVLLDRLEWIKPYTKQNIKGNDFESNKQLLKDYVNSVQPFQILLYE